MKLKKIKYNFSVCKIKSANNIDFNNEFCFIGKTDEEISLVCITDCIPDNVILRSDGWKAFKVEGSLDFSLIGILAKISSILAENNIPVFVVSTYNTDYVLTKSENYIKALDALEKAGYEIE